MTWHIKAEILNAASRLKIDIFELTAAHADAIRTSVLRKFAVCLVNGLNGFGSMRNLLPMLQMLKDRGGLVNFLQLKK